MAKSVLDYKSVHPREITGVALLSPSQPSPLGIYVRWQDCAELALTGYSLVMQNSLQFEWSQLFFFLICLWVKGTITQSMLILVKFSREKQLCPQKLEELYWREKIGHFLMERSWIGLLTSISNWLQLFCYVSKGWTLLIVGLILGQNKQFPYL